MKQSTNTILMIEPIAFGFNDQTAINNYFQQKGANSSSENQTLALSEFGLMVDKLRNKGVRVIVVRDTQQPHTPDSIFPNNWVSTHADGCVALYPMYAPNRRDERRNDILEILQREGFQIKKSIDYTSSENEGRFLEGTGSMILDHEHKIAYAAISQRTDKELFLKFCHDFDYKPHSFYAYQSVKGERLPIYHTNVMMCIADRYAVVCLDTIDNIEERVAVIRSFEATQKEIITISESQMHRFAGNMLQVENYAGAKFLVMSQTAFESLTMVQIEQLKAHNEIITSAVPTIEKLGGGSVRCMMAEVFLPKNLNL
ncbi:MAG: arginine deiminase-related protein [Bacteroidales bacterium]|nr:arginine deiminase-related protein [Bacteroidales bacterium]